MDYRKDRFNAFIKNSVSRVNVWHKIPRFHKFRRFVRFRKRLVNIPTHNEPLRKTQLRNYRYLDSKSGRRYRILSIFKYLYSKGPKKLNICPDNSIFHPIRKSKEEKYRSSARFTNSSVEIIEDHLLDDAHVADQSPPFLSVRGYKATDPPSLSR